MPRCRRSSLLLLSGALIACGSRPLSAHVPQTAPSATPALLSLPPVSYPATAQAMHVSGRVDLELLVRADGTVSTHEVTKSVALLDQAALDAARRSRFRCDHCGTEPVLFRLSFDFRLELGALDTVEAAPGGAHVVVYAKPIVINPRTPAPGATVATVIPARLPIPVYPQIAKSARVEGTVVVELEVSPDGAVASVTIARSVPLLEQAVLDALRASSFGCDGCDAPLRQTIQYEFRLTNLDAPPLFEVGPDRIRIGVTAAPPVVMPQR